MFHPLFSVWIAIACVCDCVWVRLLLSVQVKLNKIKARVARTQRRQVNMQSELHAWAASQAQGCCAPCLAPRHTTWSQERYTPTHVDAEHMAGSLGTPSACASRNIFWTGNESVPKKPAVLQWIQSNSDNWNSIILNQIYLGIFLISVSPCFLLYKFERERFQQNGAIMTGEHYSFFSSSRYMTDLWPISLQCNHCCNVSIFPSIIPRKPTM